MALALKVQLVRLLPLLEHAPDQIALRPFETLSVIELPAGNEAVALLPTGTLMPAGLDVIRSPLRPLALTVRAMACAWVCGEICSVALRVTPAALPVMVAVVEALTVPVAMAKVALVVPWATNTLAGTDAAAWLLVSVTTAPPFGAAAERVAVPCTVLPPTTLDGLSAMADSTGAAGMLCGVKRRVADQLPAAPFAFSACTRHQWAVPGRVPAVKRDWVTSWSVTKGAANVLELSIWIR